ncbi:cytochrome P450 [Streptantibioticus parmotrematis]|uniref:cytochrome P450 family protein n=1 Tax=Streptantibioticus parmotrematis TaxID=2873249 RepID=UPI0033FC0C78
MRNSTPSGCPVTTVDTEALIADPHSVYAGLREAGPVHRVTGPDGRPAWLVVRYEDVRRALADPRFSLDKRNALPGNYDGLRLPSALDANLLNMDPPDHTRVRRLVAKAFTPGRVERLREPVTRLARELLDAVAPDGGADLLAAYAGPLPIAVICDLLGVPPQARVDFRAWTDRLITPDPAHPEATRDAVVSMMRFYAELIASKRERPGDDLLSDLIAVRDDASEGGEDRLSEDELTSLAFLVLFAGYENTVHLIANAVLALLDDPERLRELREHPERLAGAADEFARFDGPGPLAIRRFPVTDVEVGGVTVPAGETVLLAVGSANRDPERFAAPDRLDFGRDRGGHLGLGHGIHYCLGAALARMETEVALRELLARFPAMELSVPRSELRWRPTIRARGLISLPVRWEGRN